MRQAGNRAVVEQRITQTSLATWAWWTAATMAGGTLGELVLRLVEGALAGTPAILAQIISWTVLGLVLGTLQWLVLRRVLGRVDAWIPATALAGALAFPIFNT